MANTNYVIATDSGCDLPYSLLNEKNVICVDLTVNFEGSDEVYRNRELDIKEFYQNMRDGKVSRTAACNPEDFKEAFTPILKEGKDIFYIGLDSGISTTVNSARLAAEELAEDFPERTIKVLDPLCASAGEGLMVLEAIKRLEAGVDLEESYQELEAKGPGIGHRFTVETLTYLCRGGRVSKAAMLAGNVLNIKPVLHVDDEGHLINILKVRGRMKSIQTIAQQFADTQTGEGLIVISHGDCEDEAQALADLIEEKTGRKVDLISMIGPVIGSHAGPGTIALFFEASGR